MLYIFSGCDIKKWNLQQLTYARGVIYVHFWKPIKPNTGICLHDLTKEKLKETDNTNKSILAVGLYKELSFLRKFEKR